MLQGTQKQKGFTIVELLIVIVVIAILAAISVVAYTGIQNRANDSAIQSDLNNFAKKVQLVASETGNFPVGGASRSGGVNTGNSTTIIGFTFAPTKSAYRSTVHNLFYCTGVETATGQSIFRVAGRSVSGNTFQYSSKEGLQNLGDVGLDISICQGLNDPHTWGYGYNLAPEHQWFGWTNG